MSAEKQKTILLVEDEMITAMSEKMILEKFGYKVITANTGEDAVTAVGKTPGIDLILMDINLGDGIDGPEAAASILRKRDLPVVFLSSHTEPEVVAKTEKITSYGYVVKNSSITALDASIKMAFKLFEARIKELEKESQREAALKALQESEQRLNFHVNNSPLATIEWTTDFIVTRWSDEAEKIFGWNQSETIGKPMLDLKMIYDEDIPLVRKTMERLSDGSTKRVISTNRNYTKKGKVILCEWYNSVLLNPQGKMISIMSQGINITERSRVESQRKTALKALRESEVRFRRVSALTSDIAYSCRTKENGCFSIDWLTGAAELITGYSGEEIKKQGCWRFMVIGEDLALFEENVIGLAPDSQGSCELRFRHKNGGIVWIASFAECVAEAPTPGHLLLYGGLVDISVRKKTEGALTAAENTYRNIFLNAQTGLFRTDIKTSLILDANDSVARFIGFKDRGELLAKPFNIAERYIDHKDRERMVSLLLKDGQLNNFETRFKRNDGTIIWIRMAARIVPEKGWIEGVSEDITKEKAAEAALQDSEEKFRLLVENINDVLYTLDANGRITYISPVIERISGRKPADFLGKSFSEFVHPGDLPVLAEKFKQTLGGARESFEFRVINGNQIHHVRTSSQRLLNNGVVSGLNGLMSDITEENRAKFQREAALQELREAKALTDAIVESVPLMIFLKEAKDLRFVIFNRAGEELLGYDRESLLGKSDLDFFPAEQAAFFIAKDREVLDGEAGILDIPEESIQTAKKGQRLLHTRKVSIRGNDGISKYLLGISEDITERKKAEEEIKRQLSEKVILLKEVHHRIKNNIASIAGLLSLRLQSISNPEAVAVLRDAIGRVNSMHILYDKLLLSEDFEDISVKNYIESLADLVVALFPDKTKITLDKRIADFQLDPKRLFPIGIIINELITNKMKYAFSGRDTGKIKIALKKVDKQVKLIIEDNGNRLPDEFDINQSTGFGLTLVKMLSQQLGGSFSMEKHEGTRCTVEFNI